MSRDVLRFVVVTDPNIEVGRAWLVRGEIQYAGDTDTIQAVIRRRAIDGDMNIIQAFTAIGHEGWSNSYLMVDRKGMV